MLNFLIGQIFISTFLIVLRKTDTKYQLSTGQIIREQDLIGNFSAYQNAKKTPTFHGQ